MNIDSLLDLEKALAAFTDEGKKIQGEVADLEDDDLFSFLPQEKVELVTGELLKISDGSDSVMAKVLGRVSGGYRLQVDYYALQGHERRQDVRINDKLYLSLKLLGSAAERDSLLEGCRLRTQATRSIQESFIKSCYGYPGEMSDKPTSEDSQALWEINRKLDLLININLSDDFRNLMQSSPRPVNVSATGLRMVSEQSLMVGDIIEIGLILPQVPLLFINTAGEVVRSKLVRTGGRDAFAVAVHFLELSDNDREDLIRYLFKRQREQLRQRRSAD